MSTPRWGQRANEPDSRQPSIPFVAWPQPSASSTLDANKRATLMMNRDPARVALSCLLGVNMLFQLALALGAPWGAAAWGGGSEGTLPLSLRIASGLASVLWGWAALVVLGRFLGAAGQRRVLLTLGVLALVSMAMNLVSPSALERGVWTPFSMVMSVLSWLCWWRARDRADGPIRQRRA